MTADFRALRGAAIAKISEYHWPANMEVDPQTVLALVSGCKALIDLVAYGREHNWGNMPEGATTERAEEAARALTGGK